MKTDKFNLSKIKKITIIEIFSFLIVIVALGFYYSPRYIQKQEVMMAAKIKADNAVFTTKALKEFSANKDIKSSEVAQKVSEELNATGRNPYNRKASAYTFETDCKGCNSVEFDDELSMIILTTYDKKGELIARTVIKPPSFVTYLKENDKKINNFLK